MTSDHRRRSVPKKANLAMQIEYPRASRLVHFGGSRAENVPIGENLLKWARIRLFDLSRRGRGAWRERRRNRRLLGRQVTFLPNEWPKVDCIDRGAKIWSVMRCACNCDAIRQVQALRRSCRRSHETENEALPNRRAHVGKVIDAGANDYNRLYTPTLLDGDEPRRRRTSDRDTQSALISPSARRWHWPG